MLILLPPSETKAAGGDGPPVDLGALSFPELTAPRATLIDDLAELSSNVTTARPRLFAPPSKDAEIVQNVYLRGAATMPVLERYTGVLYDALDVGTMSKAQRSRADSRLVVTSSVFGMMRAADRIPGYRCSNCARLPRVGTPERYWRSYLPEVVATWDDYVVDLRSGAYASFVSVSGALTARVVTEMPDGSRKVVSHFSKYHRGLLARALAVSRAEIDTRAAVLRVARASGLRIEPLGRNAVQIITDPAGPRAG